MNKDELLKRLSEIEWEDFEVKEAHNKLPNNVWETVSAFCNTAGGWIVLGVKQIGKNFEIQGVENGEKVESDFLNTLRSGQKLNYPIYPIAKKYQFGEKTVLAFFIASSPNKPVYFGTINNTFIRSGSGDRRATDMEIAALFRDQMFGVKSEQSVPNTSFNDLNLDSLKDYRLYLNAINIPSLGALATKDDVSFCNYLHITDEFGQLTYSGLMMFGKGEKIIQHIPTFCIDYVEINGRNVDEADTRYNYRIPEQENLWNAFRVIIRRLQNIVDVPFKIDDKGRNIGDTSQFEILREALVNLLMHADQFNSIRSCIRVFTDHIEFANGGAIPVSLESIKGKCYTNPRNPTLARLFRLANVAENLGFGLNKLQKWQDLTGKNVDIESTTIQTVVSFQFKNVLSNVSGKNMGKTTRKTTTKTTRKTTTKTTDKILSAIKKNPTITNQQLSDLLGITINGVHYHIEKLKKDNIIERNGGRKYGYWEILQP